MAEEPRIFITQDGADIYMNNGDIASVAMVCNCVINSIFSNSSNNVHNKMMTNSANNFHGKTMEALKRPITVSSMALIKKAIEFDLSPLVNQGDINDLEVYVENSQGKRIDFIIGFSYSGKRVTQKFSYNNGIIEVE